MPHVLLVNPIDDALSRSRRVVTIKPSKGVRKMAKKRRSAAQQAATRRMIAARKASLRGSRPAASSGKKRRKARRRSNPVTPIRAVNAAPRRRSTKRRKARTSVAAASSAGRTLRFRRRNPIGFLDGLVKDTLVPSAIGGAGALGLDVLLAVVPLPETIKTGAMRPVVRVAGAIGLGMLAGMIVAKRTAQQITAGAVTVVLYDTMKALMTRLAGGKIPGIGVYEIPGIGIYEIDASSANAMLPAPDGMTNGMGYVDSGQQVGEYVS